MSAESKPQNIRITLTESEARALLLAIANMEADDDESINRELDKVEDKIREQRRKRV